MKIDDLLNSNRIDNQNKIAVYTAVTRSYDKLNKPIFIDKSEQRCVRYLFIILGLYNISLINGIVNCLFFSKDSESNLATILIIFS